MQNKIRDWLSFEDLRSQSVKRSESAVVKGVEQGWDYLDSPALIFE